MSVIRSDGSLSYILVSFVFSSFLCPFPKGGESKILDFFNKEDHDGL